MTQQHITEDLNLQQQKWKNLKSLNNNNNNRQFLTYPLQVCCLIAMSNPENALL